MAKNFAFVSIGILCLVLSALIGFHIGGRSVQAQRYSVPGVVEAKEFLLKDGDGNDRGAWYISDNGQAELALYDTDANPRLAISGSGDGAFVILMDKNKAKRAVFEVFKGVPSLKMTDSGGTFRVALFATDDTVLLSLDDENGMTRGMWGVDKDGPRLQLLDKNENTRAVLGLHEIEVTHTGEKRTTAESSLILFDREGKVIHQVP